MLQVYERDKWECQTSHTIVLSPADIEVIKQFTILPNILNLWTENSIKIPCGWWCDAMLVSIFAACSLGVGVG